jgi:hypothetical protein
MPTCEFLAARLAAEYNSYCQLADINPGISGLFPNTDVFIPERVRLIVLAIQPIGVAVFIRKH